MKIGIVLYPTFGGSGVVATELGKALSERGHEVHFITYNQPVRLGSFTKNLYYHEVNVSDYPLFDYPPYETVLASKLVDVVKFEKLDLLHVHYAIPHASAALMAKQILASQGIFIPFITTLHGTDITLVGRDPSFAPAITYAINSSDAVTAVSQSLKNDTYQHFEISREIEVIPNFIEPKHYLPKPEKDFKLEYAPNGERIITHISNFRPVKRVEDVVRVFKHIVDAMPAKLLLIGDGPDRYKVEQLCRDLGTCKHTHVIGKLKKPEEVLCISDLFILPSESESFGPAALEALATGVPVIATNTGGIPEVINHGVSGFLSDVGDIDDMAANALKILHSNESLQKYRANAKLRSQQFSIEKILPMYTNLYNQVLAKNLELQTSKL
ncbi:MAG TPA: N-acetyl-alpha-D-glucosaminyl L-malate synthase BshA [Cryomorphaceae bacterium]|nr:N-acetyl-alpha-D-glucosaminyl L-malate synthase BshA [Cryomorphaceae bacterium]